MRMLPWLYWPVIAVLTFLGLGALADESKTATAAVVLFVLFGTFGMVMRAEDRDG